MIFFARLCFDRLEPAGAPGFVDILWTTPPLLTLTLAPMGYACEDVPMKNDAALPKRKIQNTRSPVGVQSVFIQKQNVPDRLADRERVRHKDNGRTGFGQPQSSLHRRNHCGKIVGQQSTAVRCGPREHSRIARTGDFRDVLHPDYVKSARTASNAAQDVVVKILVRQPFHATFRRAISLPRNPAGAHSG